MFEITSIQYHDNYIPIHTAQDILMDVYNVQMTSRAYAMFTNRHLMCIIWGLSTRYGIDVDFWMSYGYLSDGHIVHIDKENRKSY